jgi:predicted transcriptional regulator
MQYPSHGAEACENLNDRLKIIEEIEKNPGQKRVDIANRLGLRASTLNTTRQEERDSQTNTEMW